jgi:hypothetical protein
MGAYTCPRRHTVTIRTRPSGGADNFRTGRVLHEPAPLFSEIKCLSSTLDFESFSYANLPDVGVYKYARDPSTEILCVAWAIDDGPVELIVGARNSRPTSRRTRS